MKPLSSWYSSSGSTAQGATGSSTSSSTTTNQPIISFDDLQQLPKPDPLNLTKQLRDDDRVLEALVPAPVGALLVAPDNLGRVLLMDGAGMVAVRIWKVQGAHPGLFCGQLRLLSTQLLFLGLLLSTNTCSVLAVACSCDNKVCAVHNYSFTAGLPRCAVWLGAPALHPPRRIPGPAAGAVCAQEAGAGGVAAKVWSAVGGAACGLPLPAGQCGAALWGLGQP